VPASERIERTWRDDRAPTGAARHGLHKDLRLPADHWIRHQTNDYSVHPKAVGRRVHVKVDDDRSLSPWAKVWPATSVCLPATSPSPTRSMTGPEAAERSRRHQGLREDVEIRSLAVYDRVTGAA